MSLAKWVATANQPDAKSECYAIVGPKNRQVRTAEAYSAEWSIA